MARATVASTICDRPKPDSQRIARAQHISQKHVGNILISTKNILIFCVKYVGVDIDIIRWMQADVRLSRLRELLFVRLTFEACN